MNNRQKAMAAAITLVVGLLLWSLAGSAQNKLKWNWVEVGLQGTVLTEDIWVFRIHQKDHSFYVEGSKDTYKPLTEWAEYAAGGINLNMYIPGSGLGADPQGYTKIRGVEINPVERGDWNSFIVWDSDTLLILDRYSDGMEAIYKWPNISQNIRMYSNGKNRWSNQAKKWSVAVLATTTDGNVLMIHSRKPYRMHEFIDIVTSYEELKVDRMAYLEGGPESSLVMYGHFSRPLRVNQKIERVGSYETGFNENDENITFWHLPWTLCFGRK
jgi:hypothetical protein